MPHAHPPAVTMLAYLSPQSLSHARSKLTSWERYWLLAFDPDAAQGRALRWSALTGEAEVVQTMLAADPKLCSPNDKMTALQYAELMYSRQSQQHAAPSRGMH